MKIVNDITIFLNKYLRPDCMELIERTGLCGTYLSESTQFDGLYYIHFPGAIRGEIKVDKNNQAKEFKVYQNDGPALSCYVPEADVLISLLYKNFKNFPIHCDVDD